MILNDITNKEEADILIELIRNKCDYQITYTSSDFNGAHYYSTFNSLIAVYTNLKVITVYKVIYKNDFNPPKKFKFASPSIADDVVREIYKNTI